MKPSTDERRRSELANAAGPARIGDHEGVVRCEGIEAMRTRSPRWIGLLGAMLTAVAVGCLYDASERCGPGEVLNQGDSCVCAPGNVPVYRNITVLSPVSATEQRPFTACVPCGTNQVIKGDQCVCAAGFVMGAAGCVPSNLGAPCAAEADCAAGDQTHCRLPEGYCTKQGCATNADCNADADYACAATATPPYCKRPPVGEGRACTMQGLDPACTAEAPVCVFNGCVTLPGCKVDGDCSPSRKCCDFTKFGQAGITFCLAGACP